MLLAFMVIVGIAIIVLSYQQRNPAIMLFANIPALVITTQKGLPFWVGLIVVTITILGITATIAKIKNWLINSLVVVTNVMAASCVLHAYLAAHVTVFQSVLIAVAIALIVFMAALLDGLWRIPALILAAELYALAYSIGANWATWLGYALVLAIVLGAIFTATLAKGKSKFFIIVALVIALVCLVFALWGSYHKPTFKSVVIPKPTTVTAQKPNQADRAKEDLSEKGWKDNQYSEGGNVDESKDKSTAGTTAFNHQRITSVTTLIEWFKSGTKASKTVLEHIASKTEATSSEILNPENWVRIQSKVPFQYPGNTGLSNGAVIDAGARNGEAGDIFFAFVSKNGKIVYLRGGCANPQLLAPEPKRAEDDPAAKSNAPVGVGKNQDPGLGAYIPPEKMEHPLETPKVNPDPPKATTTPIITTTIVTTPNLPVGAKADPTPAPAPEMAAPTKSAPAKGVSRPPGM